jgi:hypothetical protein
MRWIIGDIHGMFRPLDALIGAVERRDQSPHFMFVGDYVNRGPDSPRVIDRILALPRASCVRGNHDDVLDLILHGDCFSCHHHSPSAISGFTWFMQYGLAETLMAYGADAAQLEHLWRHPDADVLRKTMEVIPARHRQFIHELPPVVEHADLFVAHAMWDVDEPDGSPEIAARLRHDPRLRHQILWGRYSGEQIRQRKRWRRTGYFGHTPVMNYTSLEDLVPLRGPQIVLLDTAAALVHHGRLSAVCAETGEVVQAVRDGSVI